MDFVIPLIAVVSTILLVVSTVRYEISIAILKREKRFLVLSRRQALEDARRVP